MTDFNLYFVSEYSVEVVKYMAGFVVKRLGEKIKCEFCLNAFIENKENIFYVHL